MKKISICLLLASASALAVAAENPSVNGKWQVRMAIGGYESVQVCTFSQSGTDLSVRCAGGMGAANFTGKVHGRKVGWSFSTKVNGGSFSQIYQGELVSPTRIEGSVSMIPLGAGGDLTATLCPPSSDDKSCLAGK